MEAKYILEYSDFPSQKVLSKINENEKEIVDAFTRRRLVQQGYQSELKTLFKPITDEIKKLPLQSKLTAITNKIEELKQADTANESLGKLMDEQTRIVNILDAIRKSAELKEVLILINKRPTVKRWLADEDVELDEVDQRIINKLSSDKLDIVKEYVKLEAEEEVPGSRKEEFALHDLNIEQYSRIKDFISRFELTNLRENIGFNNMDPKGTISINGIPVYFSDSKINENEKEIVDAFTQRRLVQQGYQSELKTLFKPITDEIKKLPLQSKLTAISNKIEELKQAGTANESLRKLSDEQTRIVNILDAIRKSSELKDVVILINKRPNVKRWLADEDVELDEADQRVIDKLPSDNLDIIKEYAKLEAEEEVPGNRKEEFALHDLNIEKYSLIKDYISRFELMKLRENIGFNNMDSEGTVTINGTPVYFSDNEIKIKDKTYPFTDGLLSVLTFPRSTAELTKEEARNYIDILEGSGFRFQDYRDKILKRNKKTQKLVDALYKLGEVDKYYPGVMLEFQSKSTVYSVRQSSEKYLAPEEVLREMYIGNKKFNLNSPLDKDFIEGHWAIRRDEIEDVLTDRQKNSEFILSLDATSGKGTGVKFLTSNVEVLVNELNRLLGSFRAGNNGIFNEIAAITDELRRKGVLNINHVKNIYKFLTTK